MNENDPERQPLDELEQLRQRVQELEAALKQIKRWSVGRAPAWEHYLDIYNAADIALNPERQS